MAERRMFSKIMIDSDKFLDMPASVQLLYFHLAMRADDDGFVNQPKSIMRMCGTREEDMKRLIDGQLIIAFDSGIVVITHWKLHNYIRKDTYKETLYQEEKSLLTTDENGIYHFSAEAAADTVQTQDQAKTNTNTDTAQSRDETVTDTLQSRDGSLTQDRIGKDRKGKDKILLSAEADPNPPCDSKKIMDLFNSVCVSLPKIQKLTNLRRKKISSAAKMLNGDFEELFQRIEKSDFLTGRNGSWNGCSFDWILKPSNLLKIMEGNYDNKEAAVSHSSPASPSYRPEITKPTYDLDSYENMNVIMNEVWGLGN